MLQIIQNLSDGATSFMEVPAPTAGAGHLLIRSVKSLISSGTERMLLDFGKANWIEKARQQPDQVQRVLSKIKTDGLLPTLESVQAKLDKPVALGYSSAGTVLEVGPGVVGFERGDRVVSSGPHAEIVRVPANLCAKVPDSVSDDDAAFAIVGAIALQGIRLAQPSLGEIFVVTGLGLIGLMAVQFLRAHGCRVLGIDFDPSKLRCAEELGAETVNLSAGEDPVRAAERFSRSRGVDAVIIAAATNSNEPVHQAALMCRKRGRIILIGVTGLELSRDDFYKKELSFQVSCSYGPGRYDPVYEQKGQDYPFPYVRWTAQRNFEAVLQLMADRRLNISPLITHRFPLERAQEAYGVILGEQPHLGVLLEYPAMPEEGFRARTIRTNLPEKRAQITGRPSVALIGAGQHAVRMLLPAIGASGANFQIIADNGGISAAHAARKFGFAFATTDTTQVFSDPAVDTVFIATRHDSHARLVCEALRARKNVFVEKPLAIRAEELEEIEAAYATARGILMVGFNRRFAPHTLKLKELLGDSPEPKAMIMTVNAGAIPADHWTQDEKLGGGRIIGEGCHFIDLLRFLAGCPIMSSRVTGLSKDTATVTLTFADGSVGTVHYLANGHKSFPKERLEVFCRGRNLQLDNFRRLTGYGWPGFRKMVLWRQDKGHSAAVAAFLAAVRNGESSPFGSRS